MLQTTIKAYLYQQYSAEDNLQAFVTAYNSMSQEIYEWLITANLPIFIGNYNYADQLEWIARGIYGQQRPIISSSKTVVYGPYNTIKYNQVAFNSRVKKTTSNQITTSDDIFKRVMMWNFYKGDGFYFTVPWLKRRVMRFLTGVNGNDIVNDSQFNISVEFDGSGGLTITIGHSPVYISESTMYGATLYSGDAIGTLTLGTTGTESYPFAGIFKSAFDNGLLHMPFWATVTVNITSG